MKPQLSFLYFNSVERKSWVLLVTIIFLLLSIQSIIKRKTIPHPIDYSKHGALFYEHQVSDYQLKSDFEKSNASINKYQNQVESKKQGKKIQFIQKNNPEHYKVDNANSHQANDVSYLLDDTIQQHRNPTRSIAGEKDTIDVHLSDKKEMPKVEPRNTSPILIDINSADEIQLQYVKGIGPAFAERIIKYRELIGGFHHIHQLMEVYGIDRDKFIQLKDQIKLTGETEKININSLDQKQISRHPYISYQEAKLIVAYRKKHGPYKSVYDITKIGVMDSSFVKKILPYIPDTLRSYNAQAPLTSL